MRHRQTGIIDTMADVFGSSNAASYTVYCSGQRFKINSYDGYVRFYHGFRHSDHKVAHRVVEFHQFLADLVKQGNPLCKLQLFS